MNDLRTAAEQALELCDRINDERTVWGQHELRAVCEALRAALAEPVLAPAPGYCKHCKQYTIEEPLPAEPVQEPVTWGVDWGRDGDQSCVSIIKKHADGTAEVVAVEYSPPQRKPLTEEEIDELSRAMVKGDKSVNWLCRAIERAHGIGDDK